MGQEIVTRSPCSPYPSRKYPAGFLRTLAILTKVFMDGSDAPVSYREIRFCWVVIGTKVRIGCSGGEGGLRTLEAPFRALNRLAGDRFRPLSHLSQSGALGGTRTPNLRIRNPTLYPIELQAQLLYALIHHDFE